MEITLPQIEEAMANNDFYLEYLPTINLKNGRCVGAEALIRWEYQGQLIPPLQFIPLIENTPLAGLVTFWIMDRLAQDLLEWLKKTEQVYISFNVPPEILGRGGLRFTAKKSNLTDLWDKIIIEVTERGIPDKLGIKALNLAHKHGVKTGMDDVDIEDQEKLDLLGKVDVDVLKLDKHFADDILRDDWNPEKLKTIVKMAGEMGAIVVAEGIETAKQYNVVKTCGVIMGQGWYFSKELSAEDFKEYYKSHNQD